MIRQHDGHRRNARAWRGGQPYVQATASAVERQTQIDPGPEVLRKPLPAFDRDRVSVDGTDDVPGHDPDQRRRTSVHRANDPNYEDGGACGDLANGDVYADADPTALGWI